MSEENKKDKRKEYRLDDFQLSKISELDYESLTNLIDKGKEIINLDSCIKSSSYSLFIPISPPAKSGTQLQKGSPAT